MFSTWKQRAILGIYVFLVLSIPLGAYMASQQQTIKSQAASDQADRKIEGDIHSTLMDQATASAQQQIIQNLLNNSTPSASPSPSDISTDTSTLATTFGPTMNFSLVLEGRPVNNQSSSVFVGISSGTTAGSQPNYLLSFTIDLPANGTYTGLSLAGLTVGNQYTAFIKPTAQIATSSVFVMSPAITTLNGSTALTLLTGDLNEDNVVNTADYNIALAAYGSTPKSTNWNATADFNKDNVVNNYDMSYIYKNFGQTGQTGPWQSTPLQTTGGNSTPVGGVGGVLGVSSGSALPAATTHPNGSKGYWIWVPQ